MSGSETLKQRTWRERMEAAGAVEGALAHLRTQERLLNDAKAAFQEALDRQSEAVQRNIDAWKGTDHE